MSKQLTRREMLRTAALGSAGMLLPLPAALAAGKSPNERLNIACVGVGWRGRANPT